MFSVHVHAISSINLQRRWKWNMKIRPSWDWRAVHAVLFRGVAIRLLLFLRSVTGCLRLYRAMSIDTHSHTCVSWARMCYIVCVLRSSARANECSEIFTSSQRFSDFSNCSGSINCSSGKTQKQQWSDQAAINAKAHLKWDAFFTFFSRTQHRN